MFLFFSLCLNLLFCLFFQFCINETKLIKFQPMMFNLIISISLRKVLCFILIVSNWTVIQRNTKERFIVTLSHITCLYSAHKTHRYTNNSFVFVNRQSFMVCHPSLTNPQTVYVCTTDAAAFAYSKQKKTNIGMCVSLRNDLPHQRTPDAKMKYISI